MYDLIVIGNDVSSLVAAHAASRLGKKTLLIAENDPPDFFSEAGYLFDVNPFPLTGLAENAPCSLLLDLLDPLLKDDLNTHALDPGLQIIQKESRLDLYGDPASLSLALSREYSCPSRLMEKFYAFLGNNMDIFSSLTDEFSDGALSTSEKLRKAIKRSSLLIKGWVWEMLLLFAGIKAPALRRTMTVNREVFTHIFGGNYAVLSMMYGFSRPLAGIYGQRGSSTFKTLLRSSFLNTGGTMISNAAVMKISAEKGISVNILAGETPSRLAADKLIVSTAWEKLKMVLTDGKALRNLQRHLGRVRTNYYAFTVPMGVLEKGLPEKMACHVALLPNGYRPARARDLVFLKSSLPGDLIRAPEGRRALSATVFLDDSPPAMSKEDLYEAANYAFKSTAEFLPFLRENIDYLDLEQAIAWSRSSRQELSSWPIMKKSLFHPYRPAVRTPLKNLFVTGGILIPGFGTDGEIMSGLAAAAAATEGKVNA